MADKCIALAFIHLGALHIGGHFCQLLVGGNHYDRTDLGIWFFLFSPARAHERRERAGGADCCIWAADVIENWGGR